MKDPTSQLRSATRRAKSDVANKIVSMFLHELSKKIAEQWRYRIDGEEYGKLVREWFNNKCPYCSLPLADGQPVIEHLDGMNRYRAGLHVAGNVLVACKRCNSEKRRDDSAKTLSLAESGWASFLSHDGSRCAASCPTCTYWCSVWKDETERRTRLRENSEKITFFSCRLSRTTRNSSCYPRGLARAADQTLLGLSILRRERDPNAVGRP